jgi:hypothetical protein
MALPNPGKFKRTIKAGDTGNDVIAWKIITSRAGCWPWAEFDNIAHKEFLHGHGRTRATSGIKGLQKLLGITQDGVPGPETFKKSIPYRAKRGIVQYHAGEYIWDAHACALYRGYHAVTPQRKIVTDVFKWWQWMVDHTVRIGYSQGRPMWELARHLEPPELPFDEDCSITFSYCAFLGGARAPDPDYKYSGLGNTGSLVRGGFWISESDILKYNKDYYLGAIYGKDRWNTHHIAAIKSPSKVYSMGNESAPEIWDSIHRGPGEILCVRAYPVV